MKISEQLRAAHFSEGAMPVHLRKKKLLELRKAIQKKEVLIHKALKDDLGKSSFETHATESGFILEEISYIVSHLDDWTKAKKVKTPLTLFPGKSKILPEPYGVVLIISPWNYPFQLALSPLIGAIAAGNKVVLKPSEFAPETSEVVKSLVEEVFSKKEVVIVNGGAEETQSLLSETFDYIFFTGSTMIGKLIMKAAAENLTPVTLELGGKSPCLIEESADIDLAAKRIVWGKFLNSGQTCVAPDYLLVPEGRQDELFTCMREHLRKFYGSEISKSPDYPRIINSKHFDRLKNLIIREKIVIGGETDQEEKFISPTVMKDVQWDDKIMEDEIFGPILPVLTYSSLDSAIDQIIRRPKPLAFYVFSNNEQKKKMILERVPFGGGCINDTIVHLANPNLPFGGIGASGIGSYHGRKTFETFSHFKSVFEQSVKVDIPLRYPPYEGKLNWLKFFIR